MLKKYTPPKVTVVMNVYDQRRDWFTTAIDTICNQTYPNMELIVSTVVGDSANQWIEAYTKFPRSSSVDIRVVSQDIADAKVQINEGIKVATGDYIMFVCSDDSFYPDAVEKMVDVAVKEDALIVYHNLHYCDEDLNMAHSWKAPPVFKIEDLRRIQIILDFSLVNKSVYDEFGLLDVSWKKFAFWDKWLDVAEKYPDRIFHCDISVCKYRRHKNQLSVRAKTEPALTGENLRERFYAEKGIKPSLSEPPVLGELVMSYENS